MTKKIFLSIIIAISTISLAFSQSSTKNNKCCDKSINEKQKTKQVFELIKLSYPMDALEPVISKETMAFHYGKHLQGYVKNLNELIKGTDYEYMSLEDIIIASNKNKDAKIFNNAGQTLNHNLYFTQFAPNKGGEPNGKLLDAIKKKWGSFENFQKEFNSNGNSLFGSGWVWLSSNCSGELFITKEANGSNPVIHGYTPLMGVDLWEHAYYLSYQNRRADHIKDIWSIIDWDIVSSRYKK